jgi:hypothetical protein
MTVTVTAAVDTRHHAQCWLMAPLDWPAPRPGVRQLHRMLASMADLIGAVAAAHRLATELAALPDPPGQGWPTALTAIDAAAVGPTDTAALACQLTDHGMHQAADQLRRGLHHRVQALQLLRRTVRTSWPWPVALDHRHMAALLAEVTVGLDQAGHALAAADHALITATRKAHP